MASGLKGPTTQFPQDATRYFDYHHTADDTFDKVDPEDLAKNVAAYAVTALVAAEVDVELGPAPAFEE